MSKFLMVGLGGFLGSMLRYGAGLLMQQVRCSVCPPLGTLAVNVLGCLMIGLLGGMAESRGMLGTGGRLFLLIGLLGGFTTFSSFGMESFELIRGGQWAMAFGNVLAQVAFGLAAVWMGFSLARFF